eukprot:5638482-Pleurochrysis_carterae.AAC.2
MQDRHTGIDVKHAWWMCCTTCGKWGGAWDGTRGERASGCSTYLFLNVARTPSSPADASALETSKYRQRAPNEVRAATQ